MSDLCLGAAEQTDRGEFGAALTGRHRGGVEQSKGRERERVDVLSYPGIHFNPDMFTLGSNLRPWPDGKAIPEGPSICSYVHSRPRAL